MFLVWLQSKSSNPFAMENLLGEGLLFSQANSFFATYWEKWTEQNLVYLGTFFRLKGFLKNILFMDNVL